MNTNSLIELRATKISDLETLFQFQLDKEGGHMAAFMPENASDKAAYLTKYMKLLNDPSVNNQTLLLNKSIVGSMASFSIEGEREITYWIDREFWGQKIASTALETFLTIEKERPLFARVAFDNQGSRRVLEKAGFVQIGKDKGFASARQKEIEEYIYQLK